MSTTIDTKGWSPGAHRQRLPGRPAGGPPLTRRSPARQRPDERDGGRGRTRRTDGDRPAAAGAVRHPRRHRGALGPDRPGHPNEGRELMPQITLRDVPWPPGTIVNAYPRRSELKLPTMAPPGIPAEAAATVQNGSASYELPMPELPAGQHWAIGPDPHRPGRGGHLPGLLRPARPAVDPRPRRTRRPGRTAGRRRTRRTDRRHRIAGPRRAAGHVRRTRPAGRRGRPRPALRRRATRRGPRLDRLDVHRHAQRRRPVRPEDRGRLGQPDRLPASRRAHVHRHQDAVELSAPMGAEGDNGHTRDLSPSEASDGSDDQHPSPGAQNGSTGSPGIPDAPLASQRQRRSRRCRLYHGRHRAQRQRQRARPPRAGARRLGDRSYGTVQRWGRQSPSSDLRAEPTGEGHPPRTTGSSAGSPRR
jgi:hypothetical protein